MWFVVVLDLIHLLWLGIFLKMLENCSGHTTFTKRAISKCRQFRKSASCFHLLVEIVPQRKCLSARTYVGVFLCHMCCVIYILTHEDLRISVSFSFFLYFVLPGCITLLLSPYQLIMAGREEKLRQTGLHCYRRSSQSWMPSLASQHTDTFSAAKWF